VVTKVWAADWRPSDAREDRASNAREAPSNLDAVLCI